MVCTSNKMTTMLAVSTLLLTFVVPTAACCSQTPTPSAWPFLQAGLNDKHSGSRIAAVRVLGLIPNDPHAADLAEKALRDKNSAVRAAAATALGQMHVPGTDASLRQALNDKSLSVVMAAAHALRSLNDPVAYQVYYEVYTGERKNDTGMIAQEMKVLHDPKLLAEMGFNEGIGYVPFAGIGWEAWQTIVKDKKEGAAARAALISVLATDPAPRTGRLLLTASRNRNWVLRVAALQAIAKRNDPSLMPGVEPLLADAKREVKFAAAATVICLEDAAKVQATSSMKIAQTTQPARASGAQIWNAALETK